MSDETKLQQLVGRLGDDPALAEGLPARESAIVRAAMAGRRVQQIASEFRMEEDEVWRVLDYAARRASEGADKGPRPSQAEGEAPGSGNRPGGSRPSMDEAPRPSQAEGELEDVEESLRRKGLES